MIALRLSTLGLVCLTSAISVRGPARPWLLDAAAPIDERVAALLSAMTLEEKVNQLLIPWPDSYNATSLLAKYGSTSLGAVYAYSISFPGMTASDSLNYLQAMLLNSSRLGIPVTYISETLHSSVSGGAAFPNPTLLSATWDVNLIEAVGAVIGLEARIAGVGRGYAPVLQVTTDPRFGRYEEAYGEDPFLVSRCGLAMVLGQQGAAGGPDTYINSSVKVALEAKHAAAYAFSGRDWGRADISERTLMDVYIRPWKAAIQEGGLRGLMVSHNEINGLPNHGSGPLLSGILRGLLGGEKLFFSSDAGDVSAIESYGITASGNESAIYALTAGLDQELVASTYPSLVDSVTRGLVDISYVDAAVTRLLREKFALGLFDGHWQINASAAAAALDAPAHRALAYTAAAEGIVLLQNDAAPNSPNGAGTPLLPLTGLGTSITRIALVGPNLGCPQSPHTDSCPAAEAYRGGYCAGGSHTVTLYEALANLTSLSIAVALGANATDWTDESGIPAAVAAAAAAQLTIAVVGDTASGCVLCVAANAP